MYGIKSYTMYITIQMLKCIKGKRIGSNPLVEPLYQNEITPLHLFFRKETTDKSNQKPAGGAVRERWGNNWWTVLASARSDAYEDLGAKFYLSVLVAVSV